MPAAILFGFLAVSAIVLRVFVADSFSQSPQLSALLELEARPASV